MGKKKIPTCIGYPLTAVIIRAHCRAHGYARLGREETIKAVGLLATIKLPIPKYNAYGTLHLCGCFEFCCSVL